MESDQQTHCLSATPDPARALLRKRARQVHGALAEVNPLTLEEWEEAFRREPDFGHGMLFWYGVAQRYRTIVAAQPGMGLEQRKHCLHRILASC